MTYTLAQGYTVEDLLHFGYSHVYAAKALFEADPAFLDSAGYLMHLGVELVLKAWHLQSFGQFDNTHDLVGLAEPLKTDDEGLDLGETGKKYLRELDRFYLLRYSRREEGPVEVGSDQLAEIEELLDALWRSLPNTLVETYHGIDWTKKGGRVLMKRANSGAGDA